ncbi:MAG: hypothetical protein RR826_07585, partial [Christensenellaceae bacterium]
MEFKQEGNGYIGFHVTVQQGGVNAEIQLTTNEMFKVKLASDAIYEKWRMRDPGKLTDKDWTQKADDDMVSRKLWSDYFEKLGLTPEVLRMASDSLMEFMRNTSPPEPSSVHLPSRNQRSLSNLSDESRNTAITSSSSLSPKYTLDSNIKNTPFNQDLSNEISTA